MNQHEIVRLLIERYIQPDAADKVDYIMSHIDVLEQQARGMGYGEGWWKCSESIGTDQQYSNPYIVDARQEATPGPEGKKPESASERRIRELREEAAELGVPESVVSAVLSFGNAIGERLRKAVEQVEKDLWSESTDQVRKQREKRKKP